jgi:hypothetical protein
MGERVAGSPQGAQPGADSCPESCEAGRDAHDPHRSSPPVPQEPAPPSLSLGVRRIEWLLLLAGVVVALAFAAYTDHTWEDYYITYRSGKNLALGHGLVFQPGERVMGYTSPIGVLLPALLSSLTGNTSDKLVLWLFRLISAGLFAGTGLLVVRAHRRLGVAGAATVFTLLLAATEVKLVAFAVNGQEAAFLVCLLCASWVCLVQGPQLPIVPLAAAWVGLQYTRPDGFVYAAVLAAGVLAFAVKGLAARLAALRRMVAAARLALLFVSPWLLWTWYYYGTPVPHTLLAKRVIAPPHDLWSLLLGVLTFPVDVLSRISSTGLAFAPIYAWSGCWPEVVVGPAQLLGAIPALYWMLPFGSPAARAVSLAFALGHFYQGRVILPMPWYLPGTTILGVLALGLIADDVLRLRDGLRAQGMVQRAMQVTRVGQVLAACILAFFVSVLLASALVWRVHQMENEDNGRTRIGLWLREHASPGDSVFLEPLGYIGFFSGLKMLDFPGLASPEVSSAIRETKSTDWGILVARLDPDWLVLRPNETQLVFGKEPRLVEKYEVAQVFDATARLKAHGWLPAPRCLDYDRTYYVFHRRAPRPEDAARH